MASHRGAIQHNSMPVPSPGKSREASQKTQPNTPLETGFVFLSFSFLTST